MSHPEKVATANVPELTIEQKLEDKPTFPEGGLQAWLTIAGA
jgi:hypothetical protein